MANFASGKNAWSICQRSGLRFPYREMVVEQGTGLIVHYSESDGAYNRVDHPQLHLKGVSDRIGLERPTPDINDEILYLTDQSGNYVVGLGTFGVEQFILANTGTN